MKLLRTLTLAAIGLALVITAGCSAKVDDDSASVSSPGVKVEAD
ncbi:MAG TPA: hypothetical protein VEX38_09965 [Fimbriimonadaceae bacterium]|nr:hypothetical protein [Fimbriimonadaceae bacterium]